MNKKKKINFRRQIGDRNLSIWIQKKERKRMIIANNLIKMSNLCKNWLIMKMTKSKVRRQIG